MDSVHSAEVDYAELLPPMFRMIGVIDPLNPMVQAPELVAEVLVPAARSGHPDGGRAPRALTLRPGYYDDRHSARPNQSRNNAAVAPAARRAASVPLPVSERDQRGTATGTPVRRCRDP